MRCIGALQVFVRRLLSERRDLLRAARQWRILPKSHDHRGMLFHPLVDSQRRVLAALNLAAEFHVDGAYADNT